MIPHVEEVWDGVWAWQPHLLRPVVFPLLTPATPDAVAVRHTLRDALGPWYAAGPHVGDESITGWCWCHSFLCSAALPADRAEARWGGLVEQIDGCVAWRRDLITWLHGLPDDALDQPEAALVGLVEQLVALGIYDAWYVHVQVGVAWMLDRFGVLRDDALSDRLCALTETSFTSWVAPAPRDIARFADAAAWEIVERLLDRG
ncbi:MAG: hypothetical protein H6734_25425 [Alphaproteobacteria bacterium]|nr:hypothetical protein [Alphaproteobacteria bacterium]